jgi:hypothetical protein
VKAQTVTVLVSAAVVATCLAGGAQQATAAKKGEPRIEQMVFFPGGKLVSGKVLAKRTSVRIGRRSCAVAAATPLAALLRSRPGKLGFHDYGACSGRPADSSGLFVKAIRKHRNKGRDGWVYKLRRKLATAGAADPAGPFGNGRLRNGEQVVWFYCRQFESGSCQRSLELEVTAGIAGAVAVKVVGYDDAGEGIAVAGAKVFADGAGVAVTGSDGIARFTLTPGVKHSVQAKRTGMVPSFPVRVGL